MPAPTHPLLQRLHRASRAAPIVVAHRGDSRNHPENSLPAFAAAVALGVGMIEFDVQALGDGSLVCMHDDTADRTTDAAERLGAERPLSALSLGEVRGLRCRLPGRPPRDDAPVPTLTEALAVMHPGAVPMIEHKSGPAAAYVQALREAGMLDAVLLQSFDWDFVATVAALEPRIALGLLGPSETAPDLGSAVLDRIGRSTAGLVHWDEGELRLEDLRAIQAMGRLVCTYTTDDDLGLLGSGPMGLDAVTTNLPGRLLALIRSGRCRR